MRVYHARRACYYYLTEGHSCIMTNSRPEYIGLISASHWTSDILCDAHRVTSL